jgi:hypothetical protein
VLHYDQLVRSAFPVDDVAGYRVEWCLTNTGGEVKPGEALDIRAAMRADDCGDAVTFTVTKA